MRRSEVIEHCERRIVVIHLDPRAEGMMAAVLAGATALIGEWHGASVRLLVDARDARPEYEDIAALGQFAEAVEARLAACAVIGSPVVKGAILGSLRGLSQQLVLTFPGIDEAKDWLAGV
ncbi:MAG: hypothetical protein MUF78_04955 [Candidatus Edwardsbacteria bacterium]|jgi:hypothetical protein|nr:hypothetical protein [Candidatus Edwardsbacteria bacterium]